MRLKIRDRSRALSAAMARVPSILYGATYLALIPIFAGVYTCIGRDFYHSTIQYERTLHTEADAILREFRHAMQEKFIEEFEGQIAVRNGWRVDFSTVSLHSLKVEGDTASFGLSAMFWTTDSLPIQTGVRPRIEFPLRPTISTLDPESGEWRDDRLLWIQDQPFPSIAGVEPPPVAVLFPHRPYGSSPEVLWMPTSRALTNKLVGFANATRGFPSGVGGSYLRMLYLSTVTITTLGYGDVVPLTTRARIAVALEAILGIIVIGLFLNSLTRERDDGVQGSSSPPPPTNSTAG